MKQVIGQLPNQEQVSPTPSHHREGDAVVFDRPTEQEEAARQKRENEQHEFARSQVKTNKKLAWFTGALVVATFCTIVVGICQAYIYGRQLGAMQGQLSEMQASGKQTDKLIGLYQQQLAQLTKQAGDTHDLALAARKQAGAASDLAELTQRQFEAFEDVQAAHLTIEGISGAKEAGTNNWKVSFTLANRGNSVASVWQFGGAFTGDYTAEKMAADIDAVKQAEPPGPPLRPKFSLGPGKEMPFTVEFGDASWYWIQKFAYLDIFGIEHPPISFCLIPFRARVVPCPETLRQWSADKRTPRRQSNGKRQ